MYTSRLYYYRQAKCMTRSTNGVRVRRIFLTAYRKILIIAHFRPNFLILFLKFRCCAKSSGL